MRNLSHCVILTVAHILLSLSTNANDAVAAAASDDDDADADPNPRRGDRRHRKLETRPFNEVIPDAYIVILNDDVMDSPEQIANDYGIAIQHLYHYGVKGFSSQYVESSILNLLLDDNRVQAIGQDGTLEMEQDDEVPEVVLVQLDAPNHLDEIDQSSSSNGEYAYTYTGAGVHVYIVDAGIRATHQDFGGRVASDCYNDIGTCNTATESHGTHIASLAGGSTYGVAKQVTIHDTRIYDDNGIVSWSNLMSGLDYVAGEQLSRSRGTVVVNVSMGGSAYDVVDNAIQKTLDTGAVVVVAAGNQALGMYCCCNYLTFFFWLLYLCLLDSFCMNHLFLLLHIHSTDACDRTPARVPGVVTVGATHTSPGVRRPSSNYGPVRTRKKKACLVMCVCVLCCSLLLVLLDSSLTVSRVVSGHLGARYEFDGCILQWRHGCHGQKRHFHVCAIGRGRHCLVLASWKDCAGFIE
jgi:subtilisin family serine protease